MTNQPHLLKISRLEGLTDGVFAIAMTILAFDLRLPRDVVVKNLSGENARDPHPISNLIPCASGNASLQLIVFV